MIYYSDSWKYDPDDPDASGSSEENAVDLFGDEAPGGYPSDSYSGPEDVSPEAPETAADGAFQGPNLKRSEAKQDFDLPEDFLVRGVRSSNPQSQDAAAPDEVVPPEEAELPENLPEEPAAGDMAEEGESDAAVPYDDVPDAYVPYEEAEPWEDDSEFSSDEDEDLYYKKSMRRLVRTLSIIAVCVLLVVCAGIFILFQQIRSGTGTADSSEDDTSDTTEDVVYEDAELYGVITQVSASTGETTVYTADTGEVNTFDLSSAGSITDEYGEEIKITTLRAGQIVNVQYNAANMEVELFRLTSQATELKNVYGATIEDDTLTVSGATYSIDDNLICLYQGKTFDISEMTSKQVFTAQILDGHIYTINITYDMGELILNNLDEYVDGTLQVTASTGVKSDSVTITADMDALEVPEGINTVSITLNGTLVYTAKVFITSGETTTLSLPESSERTGYVKLVCDPSTATITVDDEVYAVDETIELSYGSHTLTASADGYAGVSKTITVGQPYQRVLINMTNSTTTVSISASVYGSKVYINGTYYGEAPLRVTLSAGTYTIKLVTDGYNDVSTSLTIYEGDLERVIYFSDFTSTASSDDSSEETSSYTQESSSESSSSSAESSSKEESSSTSSNSSSDSSSSKNESSSTSSDSSSAVDSSTESSESSQESSSETSSSEASSETESSSETSSETTEESSEETEDSTQTEG